VSRSLLPSTAWSSLEAAVSFPYLSPSPTIIDHHSKLPRTKPVRYWPKACRRASPIPTLPEQNMVKSPSLPSIIVPSDDGRGKRRIKANSIYIHGKRKPSNIFWHIRMLLGALSGRSIYVR
jgi:hypothetical protein